MSNSRRNIQPRKAVPVTKEDKIKHAIDAAQDPATYIDASIDELRLPLKADTNLALTSEMLARAGNYMKMIVLARQVGNTDIEQRAREAFGAMFDLKDGSHMARATFSSVPTMGDGFSPAVSEQRWHADLTAIVERCTQKFPTPATTYTQTSGPAVG